MSELLDGGGELKPRGWEDKTEEQPHLSSQHYLRKPKMKTGGEQEQGGDVWMGERTLETFKQSSHGAGCCSAERTSCLARPALPNRGPAPAPAQDVGYYPLEMLFSLGLHDGLLVLPHVLDSHILLWPPFPIPI